MVVLAEGQKLGKSKAEIKLKIGTKKDFSVEISLREHPTELIASYLLSMTPIENPLTKDLSYRLIYYAVMLFYMRSLLTSLPEENSCGSFD